MSDVCVLQHIHCETLGTIAEGLEAQAISCAYVRTFKGEKIPDEMRDAIGLIVMGGPMGVYEQNRHPFLRAEIRLIEQALKEKKPVLGVCLGSQLLATALGAGVTKGKKKEIGWYPVTLSQQAKGDPLWQGVESPFTAYHWHGDVFELPSGAEPLASSVLTACQAFRYGKSAYGFLFHMEVTEEIIRAMIQTFGEELREERIDGAQIIERVRDHLPRLQNIGGLVFRRWASLLQGG